MSNATLRPVPVQAHAAPAGRGGVLLLIQFAPGQYVAPAPAPAVPRYGVVRWNPAGDGTYRPVVVRTEPWIPAQVSEQMFGLPEKTVSRLIQAEFVKSDRPSPGIRHVWLDSLIEHFEATRDPDFWTPERTARWSQTL